MEKNKKMKSLLFVALNLFSMQIFSVSNSIMLEKIRNELPNLKDSPTGAIDADGNYTKDTIQGLNCAGFAKWIVDGFYEPLAKSEETKYISLKAARKKHEGERGNAQMLVYEQSRDPYFGLDWTRNLALELEKKRGNQPSYKSNDVIDSTVSKYIANCGYPISLIENVLLEQAEKHPNFFFIASINGFYGKPRLWQHYHVAVFIPYEVDGTQKIAVLERNKETSFSYLLKRYPNTFCHLVRISMNGEFELMKP